MKDLLAVKQLIPACIVAVDFMLLQTQSHVGLILVGCILLRYVYVYLSNIPDIATENLLVLLLFSLFTACFGFEKAIDTTTDPLFYNCSLIWCKYLIIYFKIHILVNEF
jgi:hypothetical protein